MSKGRLKACVHKIALYKLSINSTEEVSLFHYSNKFFLGDGSIVVTVSFINHLLEFIIRHLLSELTGYPDEVLQLDGVFAVVNEKSESLHHLFDRVPVLL